VKVKLISKKNANILGRLAKDVIQETESLKIQIGQQAIERPLQIKNVDQPMEEQD